MLTMSPVLWRVVRWSAALVGGVIVLKIAQCDAVRHSQADAKIKTADSAAAVWKHAADSLDNVRDQETAALRDSMAQIAGAMPRVIRVVEHARAQGNAVTVTGPATSPREQAISPGSAPDTVSYDQIARAGDPQPYIVPRFVSTLLASQRAAIDEQAAMLIRQTGALSQALRTIATDSGTIRARDSVIANLRVAEAVSKSQHAPRFGFTAGAVVGSVSTVIVIGTAALLASHTGGK